MTKEKGLWNIHFQWEFNGVGESWEKPAMSLELINSREKGSSGPLSMTKEEAMALWDAIVDSIRLRPTTKAPAAPGNGVSGATPPGRDSAPKPRAALGTRLKSGERCTQAGIWACAHGENLGGAKRVFREGEELPEAVLDTHRRWFGKLVGRPAETVVDTAWILESYLDEA